MCTTGTRFSRKGQRDTARDDCRGRLTTAHPSLEQQVWIGREIEAAIARGVSWRELCREYDRSRTTLWRYLTIARKNPHLVSSETTAAFQVKQADGGSGKINVSSETEPPKKA